MTAVPQEVNLLRGARVPLPVTERTPSAARVG